MDLLSRPDLAWTRHSARVAAALATALAFMPAVAGGRAAAQTAPPATVEPAPGTTALTYRLTRDVFEAKYSGPHARIGWPKDLSSAPDGTLFVLDSAVRQLVDPSSFPGPTPFAVHVIAPDGSVRGIIDLRQRFGYAWRLDAGVDGSVFVLGSLPTPVGTRTILARFAADGHLLSEWDLPPGSGRDVAALPDGRAVVALGGDLAVVGPMSGAVVMKPLDAFAFDAPSAGYRYVPTLVDAAADGRITVVVAAYRTCPTATWEPPTPDPSTPQPTQTPRPSLVGLPAARGVARPAAALDGLPCEKQFIATLGPDLGLLATSSSAVYDDIAVRDGTVFTVKGTLNGGVFVAPLGADKPMVHYALAPRLPTTASRGNEYYLRDVALDIAPDGAVWASWGDGDVFTKGPVRLGVPGDPRSRPSGTAFDDRPAVWGPVRPRAVTAGANGLFVLDGAYVRPDDPSPKPRVDERATFNAAQRWTFDGRLIGQWTHIGSDWWSAAPPEFATSGAPEDIAAVGDVLYEATPGGVWRRTSAIEPDWFATAAGRLVAVDADETTVAAFDADISRVFIWTPDGRQTAVWQVRSDGQEVAASDLTVGGGRVFIADTGRNRVLVRSLNGDDLGEWHTHDGPQRIDMTVDGDIVVLGRGGWGLRYAPDGGLRAAWRMPGATGVKRADGTDITAGPDGSIYVTYSRVQVGSAVDRIQDVIEAAGIWTFEMSVPPPATLPPSPDPQHCLVEVDKTASPGRVPLGAPVSITLTAQGECPKTPLPEQILFVVDTSWSMNDGYVAAGTPPGALERARRVLVPLLGALDPSVVDVGLVTFGDGAALQTVLSDDIADLRSRILRAQADGDTRMGAGVDLAHGELNGPRRVAGARRAIVIVSDGVFKDDPRAAIAAARADGIDVHALIVTTPEFTSDVRASLVAMLGADHLDIDPSPDRAKAIIDAIGAWRTEPNVFDTLTVRDVIPGNMRYVVGSAMPTAAWDAATRTLTWTLPPRPAGMRVTLTYAVVPEEAGTWPTNVQADATWRDVRGGAGQLRFPVPHVDVVTGTRIFLPFATRTVCARWTRPIDLVLLQDISSSMSERAADGQRTKLAVAVDAASLFLDRLNAIRDRVAIVAFDADARVVAPLSNDFGAASLGLAGLRPGRGTRIDRGLTVATTVLSENSRALALPVVVLLSDGLQNGSADPVRAALPELRAIGARVFVVGYGQTVDEALLREIAGDPADYRYAPAVEDLRAVYDGVGRTLLCP